MSWRVTPPLQEAARRQAGQQQDPGRTLPTCQASSPTPRLWCFARANACLAELEAIGRGSRRRPEDLRGRGRAAEGVHPATEVRWCDLFFKEREREKAGELEDAATEAKGKAREGRRWQTGAAGPGARPRWLARRHADELTAAHWQAIKHRRRARHGYCCFTPCLRSHSRTGPEPDPLRSSRVSRPCRARAVGGPRSSSQPEQTAPSPPALDVATSHSERRHKAIEGCSEYRVLAETGVGRCAVS